MQAAAEKNVPSQQWFSLPTMVKQQGRQQLQWRQLHLLIGNSNGKHHANQTHQLQDLPLLQEENHF